MGGEEGVSTLLGDPRKAIAAMAVPLLAALVVTQVNSFADRAWCSALGSDALAAIALCSPLYYVITGLGAGLGVGAAATVAKAIGAGDGRRAESCCMQSLMFSLVFGLVLMPFLVLLNEDILVAIGSGDVTGDAVAYMRWMMLGAPVLIVNGVVSGLLRGEGAARMSTVMMVVLALTNIVLDPVLIYGLDMGVGGASLATVLATVLSAAAGLSYYRRRSYVRLHASDAGFRRSELTDILRIGGPQMAEYTVMYAMNIVLNYIVVWCAGSEGLTIYSIPNTVINITLLPAYAVGSALVSVAASALGQGDLQRLEEARSYSYRLSMVTVAIITVAVFAIPQVCLYPFTYSDGTAYLLDDMTLALRIFCLCIPFYCLIPIAASLLQAIGMAHRSLTCAILRNLVYIVLYAIAATDSLYMVYWAVVLGSVIGGFMIYAVERRGLREVCGGRGPPGKVRPSSPS